MGRLHQLVVDAIARDMYVVGDHADNQARERGIMLWQIVHGSPDGMLISERPHTKPNPTIELELVLADATRVKAVWGFIEVTGNAKLVTVHFFDR